MIPGVAGIRVSDSYIQQLLVDHTPSPSGELSCRNSSDLRCYFIDFSGYILASNQPRSEVAAGEFLGRIDEQVKLYVSYFLSSLSLVEKGIIIPLSILIYQSTRYWFSELEKCIWINQLHSFLLFYSMLKVT